MIPMALTDKVTIILCRPEGSLNIGAVCRAMKNCGLSRLVLTGSGLHLDRSQIKAMAIHAFNLFEKAVFFDTLEEALQGHALSAGLTRRRGSRRKQYSHLPEELINRINLIKRGTVALVFGNEKHGLSAEELDLCDMAVHIPTDSSFPSMNLSHAVQIIGYLLYRGSEKKVGACTPIDREQQDHVIADIIKALDTTDYFVKQDRDDTSRFLREILARSLLGKRESERLKNMFCQLGHSGGRNKPNDLS